MEWAHGGLGWIGVGEGMGLGARGVEMRGVVRWEWEGEEGGGGWEIGGEEVGGEPELRRGEEGDGWFVGAGR